MKAIICTILAGLFALACCVSLKMLPRYYLADGKIIDNWKGVLYVWSQGRMIPEPYLKVYFSPDMGKETK